MQDVEGRALGLALFAQGRIEVAPGLDDGRLLLGQAAAHGEGRLGQEDRLAVVAASRSVGSVGHEVSFRRWVIVRVSLDSPDERGAWALRRYAGRLIEIGRNTRTVMVETV